MTGSPKATDVPVGTRRFGAPIETMEMIHGQQDTA
jgi:hypothetical protein